MADVKYVITADAKGAVKEIKAVDGAVGGMVKQAQKSKSPLQGMFKQFAIGLGGVIALRNAIRGLTGFMSDAIDKAVEQERVTAQLENVLRSTSGAAGLTKDELLKLAASLQSFTTFGDEAIIGAENLLLTFTNIGEEVFPKALESVLDMSIALGQDLKTGAVQLGRALQDPIQGVTALRRVGVNFTDAQRDQIKALVESGDALSAQNLILKELQVEFGGASRAAAETFGGSLKQLKNYWGDLKEKVGEAVTENEEIRDLIKDVKDKIVELIESGKIAEWAEKAGNAIGKLLEFLIEIPDATDAVVGGFKSAGIVGAVEGLTDKVMGLKDIEMQARLKAIEFQKSLEVLKPSMEDIRVEFEKGTEHADAYMQSMKDQDARLAANKDAYVELSGEIFKTLGLIKDSKDAHDELGPSIDSVKTSVELLTTELQAQNRELELVFKNLDETVLPAYREWPGIVYNTQSELKTHIFNANDEIVRDIDTTIKQEISPLWDGLGMDISSSFGRAAASILDESTDLVDSVELLVGGLKDSVIGFFEDMVTGFLKNNVFDFVSKEAKKATDTVKENIGDLAGSATKGAAGAATGAISGLWTAGGAFLGTLAGSLLGGGGVPKHSQEHLRLIHQNTTNILDIFRIDYKEEVHIMQNSLRGIFDKDEALTIKADIRNRYLDSIDKSLKGTISAQGGFSGTLTRDTMIRAHAGETVNIQPPNVSLSQNFQTIIMEKPTHWVIKVVQDNLDRGNIRVPGVHK